VELLNKAAEKRLTLALLYSPDVIDLHGEYATADEIEKAVVAWNETGDRILRLQHQDATAGEVLSVFVWPSPYSADVFDHRGILKSKHTFPAGTAFAWIRWSEAAWKLVKQGRIRGLSMGGMANRIRLEAEPAAAVAKRAPQSLLQRVAREGSVRLS